MQGEISHLCYSFKAICRDFARQSHEFGKRSEADNFTLPLLTKQLYIYLA